jgi:hypothetical protein
LKRLPRQDALEQLTDNHQFELETMGWMVRLISESRVIPAVLSPGKLTTHS